MTHLLPVGGVPRVHRARSLVLPQLAHFATPWSVRRLATVVAGTYALRRPPDAWLPRVPALPGPCYWLVASETPMGWHGGCLATGLVRGTVRHYCLGACSALLMCARRSRQFWGGGAVGSPTPPLVYPPLLVLPTAWVLRAVPSRCHFPSPAGTQSYAVCGFRGPGAVALRVRAASLLCVCVLVHPRCLRPPPPGRFGARTTRGTCAGRR